MVENSSLATRSFDGLSPHVFDLCYFHLQTSIYAGMLYLDHYYMAFKLQVEAMSCMI